MTPDEINAIRAKYKYNPASAVGGQTQVQSSNWSQEDLDALDGAQSAQDPRVSAKSGASFGKNFVGGFGEGVGGIGLTAIDYAGRKAIEALPDDFSVAGVTKQQMLANLAKAPKLQEQYAQMMGADRNSTGYNLGQLSGQVAAFASPSNAVGKTVGRGVELVADASNLSKVAPTATNLATKLATGAASGYAGDVSYNLSRGEDKPFEAGMGTALGAGIPLAGAVTKGVIAPALREFLGASTGVGGGVIGKAWQATQKGGAELDAFKSGLGASPQEVVDEAKNALETMQTARRQAYEDGLAKIAKETMTTKNGQLYVKKFDQELGKELFVPTNLTTKGIKDVATQSLKSIGVPAKGLALDFTERPSLDANGISKVHEIVYNWGNVTPLGLNKLEQEIKGFRKGGINLSPADNRFNKYIDDLSRNIRNYVGERVPQVAEMNKNYAQASAVLDDVTKGLSLGDTASVDTAFRKLTSALRTNNEFRKQFVQELDNASGGFLSSKIAGQQMSELLPRGLARPLAGIGGAYGAGALGLAALKLIPAAILTSPKSVATMMRVAGVPSKYVGQLFDAIDSKVLSTQGNLIDKVTPVVSEIKKNQKTMGGFVNIDEIGKSFSKASVPETDLLKEAKKYKSAEEFYTAISRPDKYPELEKTLQKTGLSFRGVPNDESIRNGFKEIGDSMSPLHRKSIYFTKSPWSALSYARGERGPTIGSDKSKFEVMALDLNKNLNIQKIDDSKLTMNEIKDGGYFEYAKKNGYDGIELPKNDEIAIWNIDKLNAIDRNSLIDIWNKANNK